MTPCPRESLRRVLQHLRAHAQHLSGRTAVDNSRAPHSPRDHPSRHPQAVCRMLMGTDAGWSLIAGVRSARLRAARLVQAEESFDGAWPDDALPCPAEMAAQRQGFVKASSPNLQTQQPRRPDRRSPGTTDRTKEGLPRFAKSVFILQNQFDRRLFSIASRPEYAVLPTKKCGAHDQTMRCSRSESAVPVDESRGAERSMHGLAKRRVRFSRSKSAVVPCSIR